MIMNVPLKVIILQINITSGRKRRGGASQRPRFEVSPGGSARGMPYLRPFTQFQILVVTIDSQHPGHQKAHITVLPLECEKYC